MAAGAVIATGAPADVAGDADVREAYLGRAAL
jgi:ABC-type branched-subunit amino acid transport system ATPase component